MKKFFVMVGLMLAVGATGATRATASEAMRSGGPHVQVRASWAPADSADALWRQGRVAIADGEWQTASEIFQRIVTEYPKSAYAPDSRYWAAYAMFQAGESSAMRDALSWLDEAIAKSPNAATVKSGEARQLATRIRGQLARGGDARAAQAIARQARAAAEGARAVGWGSSSAAASSASSASSSSSSSASASRGRARPGCPSDKDDDRIEALNALLQMNSSQAMPILKKVLARRETCTESMRQKAVFIVAQGQTEESADILMETAKNDPDADVRKDAVFWLSQTHSAKAVDYLLQILKSSNDPELQDKAIFALAQSGDAGSAKAQQFLRDYAAREDAPRKNRETAIFWIGQSRKDGSSAYLRQLFSALTDDGLKDKVLFAISQSGDHAGEDWLLEQAVNPKNATRIRKQALFWASQGGASTAKIAAIYDKSTDVEFRDQVIFALSQKNDAASVDKLLDIAKNEKDRERRKKAIFWLGQSHDPRATKALQALIDR
jgi:HEAT repeat protein